MKLYTEEQVRNMLDSIGTLTVGGVDYYTSEMTPIELPSDEEIKEEAESISKGYKALGLYNEDYYDGFAEGAKWVIEKLKEQDNDKI